MTSTPIPSLCDGERLEEIAGYQTLFAYFPVPLCQQPEKPRPLVIFVPGAAHFARIAYGGHAGSRPEDFLAHWLNGLGYDFLAVSYPLESYNPEVELMVPNSPDFTITSWGKMVARTARKMIDEYSRNNEVLLLSWSMGGRILKSFVTAAQAYQLDVRLFVSLAASPGGITGLRPGTRTMRRTLKGYATGTHFVGSFTQQIKEMTELERGRARPAIPEEIYLREYFGHTPAQLGMWGLNYCKVDDPMIEDSGFITNEWPGLQEAGPSGDDYKFYPLIGSIRPTLISDLRHVLVDSATWGMILTYKLTADVTTAVGPRTPRNETWQELMNLVYSAPGEMTSETVKGNHFFFLGERGAKETAEAIDRTLAKSYKLQDRMHSLLESIRQETSD